MEPQKAKVSSAADKTGNRGGLLTAPGAGERKTIDPAVIVELEIKDESDKPAATDPIHYLYNPFLFAYATLLNAETSEEIPYVDDAMHVLTGSIASCVYHLKDPENDNQFGAFFVFPDIAIRQEGKFRLRISLFKISGGTEDPINAPSKVLLLKSVDTQPFQVYSVKTFPPLLPSSALSRSFADQGLKLRLRKSPKYLECRLNCRDAKREDEDSSDNDSPPNVSGSTVEQKRRATNPAPESRRDHYSAPPPHPYYPPYSRPPPHYYGAPYVPSPVSSYPSASPATAGPYSAGYPPYPYPYPPPGSHYEDYGRHAYPPPPGYPQSHERPPPGPHSYYDPYHHYPPHYARPPPGSRPYPGQDMYPPSSSGPSVSPRDDPSGKPSPRSFGSTPGAEARHDSAPHPNSPPRVRSESSGTLPPMDGPVKRESADYPPRRPTLPSRLGMEENAQTWDYPPSKRVRADGEKDVDELPRSGPTPPQLPSDRPRRLSIPGRDGYAPHYPLPPPSGYGGAGGYYSSHSYPSFRPRPPPTGATHIPPYGGPERHYGAPPPGYPPVPYGYPPHPYQHGPPGDYSKRKDGPTLPPLPMTGHGSISSHSPQLADLTNPTDQLLAAAEIQQKEELAKRHQESSNNDHSEH
ncbi:hypothetical protein HDV03_004621 [Kappamyces sp. JEL0829]|nr:hypothetical protein HDV03_004621 [Kappamyces sp. JEL0829]